MGEPVASSAAIVSASALSQTVSKSACDRLPEQCLAAASIKYAGRGTLPMGSVGIRLLLTSHLTLGTLSFQTSFAASLAASKQGRRCPSVISADLSSQVLPSQNWSINRIRAFCGACPLWVKSGRTTFAEPRRLLTRNRHPRQGGKRKLSPNCGHKSFLFKRR